MRLESGRRGLLRLTRPLRGAMAILTRGGWKRQLATWTLIAGALAVGGLLYAWSGLIMIGASSDHWALTRWYLHFSMRSAVRTHALGVKVPALDAPAMTLKGAGHYATGCAPCHGAPGLSRSLVVRYMVPQPPRLPRKIQEWSPAELFWIVRNGIKFTAMPAWPNLHRDDEVWAMVAFLQKLPDLAPEDYLQMAYGETDPAGEQAPPPNHLRRLGEYPEPVLENCSRCHGEAGAGRDTGAFPKLAGQNEEYLYASLAAYASGERYSGIMQTVAAALDESTLRELARHYAGLAPAAVGGIATRDPVTTSARRGGIIARRGLPRQGIPSCVHCHGPGDGARNPYYPEIAGQYADYLALQLMLFKTGKRGGSPYARIMHTAARRLEPDQIRDLARYYAALGGESENNFSEIKQIQPLIEEN